MLLQTNSYTVPRDKRVEHARLMRRIRQTLLRLGCDSFEVFEQVGANWNPQKTNDRFVQLLKFRDRAHHQSIQQAERGDRAAQDLIREFCELVDLPAQQQQASFVVGFYQSLLATAGPDGVPADASEPRTEPHFDPVAPDTHLDPAAPESRLDEQLAPAPDEHADDAHPGGNGPADPADH